MIMGKLESEKDTLLSNADKLFIIFEDMIQMCLWCAHRLFSKLTIDLITTGAMPQSVFEYKLIHNFEPYNRISPC
jgi:hypothetical protein